MDRLDLLSLLHLCKTARRYYHLTHQGPLLKKAAYILDLPITPIFEKMKTIVEEHLCKMRESFFPVLEEALKIKFITTLPKSMRSLFPPSEELTPTQQSCLSTLRNSASWFLRDDEEYQRKLSSADTILTSRVLHPSLLPNPSIKALDILHLSSLLNVLSIYTFWENLADYLRVERPSITDWNERNVLQKFDAWCRQDTIRPKLAKIQFLNLKNCHLSILPPQIGYLTGLIHLELTNNQLKNLPLEIGNLVNLKTLGLIHNRLQTLPSQVAQLAQLETLHLSENLLGSLPPEIGNLVNLKMLSLSCNQLQVLPSEITQLTQLKSLDLDKNSLENLPPEIGNLTHLKILNLEKNHLDQLPQQIGNLSNLKELILTNNKFQRLPYQIR